MHSSEVAHDLASYSMTPKKKHRFYTGVSFEPEVSAYLDELAVRMGMSRSWVLNTIVYEYAKIVEKQNLMPLAGRLEAQGSKEIIIRA